MRGRLFAITVVGMILAVGGCATFTSGETVTFLGMDAGKAVLAVGSRRYRFASKLPD